MVVEGRLAEKSTRSEAAERLTDLFMSHSISTLLIRNLHDVLGENDSARRRAVIDQIDRDLLLSGEPHGGYRHV